MKRLWIALMVAIFGITLLTAPANAAAPEQREGRNGKWMQQTGVRVEAVAELLDMTPRTILTELRAGRTIADLAEEQGVALSEVESALTAPYRERIAAQVSDGTLTQAQADYLISRADSRATAFLTLSPRRALREPLLQDMATVLEIDVDTLITRLESGTTLAVIVAESDKGIETVIAELVASKDADLTERVTLDLMTETQKNRILRAYEQRLNERLAS
jgi:hypothetical protein